VGRKLSKTLEFPPEWCRAEYGRRTGGRIVRCLSHNDFRSSDLAEYRLCQVNLRACDLPTEIWCRFVTIMARLPNQALIAVTLVLLGLTFYLAFDINRSGQEEVVRNFGAFQKLLAHQASNKVQAFLEESAEDLRALAQLPPVENLDREQIASAVEAYFVTAHRAQPASISVADWEGKVLFSTRAGLTAPNLAGRDLFEWGRRKDSRGQVYITSGARLSEEQPAPLASRGVVLATPLYRTNSEPGSAEKTRIWNGILLMSLDLEPVLTNHLSALSPQREAHRVWIMDKDGTLMLQSEHHEMTGENIHMVKPRCYQCHVSFDYAEKMLGGGAGVTQYQLKEEPEKLAAFAPMRFESASWIVVVNAPLAEVTAFVQRSYLKMLLLVAVAVAAMVLLSVVAHRSNVSRVKAEAETRRLHENLRLEGEIRRAEECYRTLFERSPDGILMMDPETTLPIEFNNAAHRQLGYSREEFARMPLSHYQAAETPQMSRDRMEQLLIEGGDVFETQHRTKTGEIRYVEVIAQTLKLAEKKVLYCIHHDVTARKQAELALTLQAEQVRQEAAVKTTLLNDVNHRVKNNLMRMVEIVRLERMHAPSAESGLRVVLGDLENRVQGMAVVHTMLSSTQWRPLPLNDLVTEIITAALSTSTIREQVKVAVVAPTEPLWVVPEQATAVALIVNELATNSIKHAFNDRHQGRLEVRLSIDGQVKGRTLVRLDYRDDGPGWPNAVLSGEGKLVGLRLIEASVRSPLHGELSLRNEGGAAASITFKLALIV
jgi:PAS domain S-box-containing protein